MKAVKGVKVSLSAGEQNADVANIFLVNGLIRAEPKPIIHLYRLISANLEAHGMRLDNSKA